MFASFIRVLSPRTTVLISEVVKFYSMNLTDVVAQLNKFAPTYLAESWDNVGLLIEPPSKTEISVMFLTNDLTEPVLEEAVECKADLILSYHPPIFSPLKAVTTKHWKGRIVGMCIEKGIAVYSPHTSFDALHGGVNDWLAKAFESAEVKPLHLSCSESEFSHQVDVVIGDKEQASLLSAEWQELLGPSVIVRNLGNNAVKVICKQSLLPVVIATINNTGGADHGTVFITKAEKVPVPGYGMGRLLMLKNPVTLDAALARIKNHLGLSHVRLAQSKSVEGNMISTVALCAGSGASVLRGVKADLLLTGEMSHHEVLDAVHRGSSVVLTEHSNSERGYLCSLVSPLTEFFNNQVKIVMSEKDADPLKIV